MEDGASRYRREKDGAAKADWPDTASDKRGNEASTLANANWDSSAASLSGNIVFDYSCEHVRSITPKMNGSNKRSALDPLSHSPSLHLDKTSAVH